MVSIKMRIIRITKTRTRTKPNTRTITNAKNKSHAGHPFPRPDPRINYKKNWRTWSIVPKANKTRKERVTSQKPMNFWKSLSFDYQFERSTRQCARIWSDNLQLLYTSKLEVIWDQTTSDLLMYKLRLPYKCDHWEFASFQARHLGTHLATISGKNYHR